MTLICFHIFIVTGSFLYWCVTRPASEHFFIHSCIYLRLLIISHLATFLGTNSLSVLICRKAVNQSINQSSNQYTLIVFFIVLFNMLVYLSAVCLVTELNFNLYLTTYLPMGINSVLLYSFEVISAVVNSVLFCFLWSDEKKQLLRNRVRRTRHIWFKHICLL